jgi:hypothetical protein
MRIDALRLRNKRDVPAVPVAGGFAVALGALGEDGVEEGERHDGGEGGEMHFVLTKGGGAEGEAGGREAWRRTKQTDRPGNEKRGIEKDWLSRYITFRRETRFSIPDPGGREAVSAIYKTGCSPCFFLDKSAQKETRGTENKILSQIDPLYSAGAAPWKDTPSGPAVDEAPAHVCRHRRDIARSARLPTDGGR